MVKVVVDPPVVAPIWGPLTLVTLCTLALESEVSNLIDTTFTLPVLVKEKLQRLELLNEPAIPKAPPHEAAAAGVAASVSMTGAAHATAAATPAPFMNCRLVPTSTTFNL